LWFGRHNWENATRALRPLAVANDIKNPTQEWVEQAWDCP
jgi:hypothetical protein